jgi:hypothetical protein
LPVPFPEDDREREGAEEIAELIGKSVQATAVLLTKHRAGPAYKFAGKWRMCPSDWYAWRDEQVRATLAKGAERAAKPVNTTPIRVREHLRRRGWSNRSAADASAAALSALAQGDGTAPK